LDLISKKDLLIETGISYGQLYRWKREGLIPEDWFIKQSAFTGQETFFPRAEILARIQSILAMKDNHSLGEVANILASGERQTLSIAAVGELLAWWRLHGGPELDHARVSDLLSRIGREEASLGEIALAAFLAGVELEAQRGAALNPERAGNLLRDSLDALARAQGPDVTCELFAAGEARHLAFFPNGARLEFDSGIRAITPFPLGETTNALKAALSAMQKGE